MRYPEYNGNRAFDNVMQGYDNIQKNISDSIKMGSDALNNWANNKMAQEADIKNKRFQLDAAAMQNQYKSEADTIKYNRDVEMAAQKHKYDKVITDMNNKAEFKKATTVQAMLNNHNKKENEKQREAELDHFVRTSGLTDEQAYIGKYENGVFVPYRNSLGHKVLNDDTKSKYLESQNRKKNNPSLGETYLNESNDLGGA